jgi:hypothetical protein
MIFSPRHPALLITLAGAALTGYMPAAHAPTGDTGPAAPARAPAVVTVEASDYALSLPAQVPAGVVTFRVVNNDKELHHAQVIRLESGKTAGDYMKAYTDKGAMPGWVRYLGGPAGTPSGQEHHSITVLTPGPFGSRTTDPSRTRLPCSSWRRERRRRISRAGGSGHGMGRRRVCRSAEWSSSTRVRRECFRWPSVPVTAGDYGFICFVPDEKDGKRHFLHGMTAQFRLP